jgi:hypothetical protein
MMMTGKSQVKIEKPMDSRHRRDSFSSIPISGAGAEKSGGDREENHKSLGKRIRTRQNCLCPIQENMEDGHGVNGSS